MNDLTRTARGFSRDDIEARIVPAYVDRGILDRSRFATIDREGVGELLEIAVARPRGARPGLEAGVCGEHGATPRPWASSTRRGWITSAARRSGSPSPA
jgi:pyruvate,orthophosphate dikinase